MSAGTTIIVYVRSLVGDTVRRFLLSEPDLRADEAEDLAESVPDEAGPDTAVAVAVVVTERAGSLAVAVSRERMRARNCGGRSTMRPSSPSVLPALCDPAPAPGVDDMDFPFTPQCVQRIHATGDPAAAVSLMGLRQTILAGPEGPVG